MISEYEEERKEIGRHLKQYRQGSANFTTIYNSYNIEATYVDVHKNLFEPSVKKEYERASAALDKKKQTEGKQKFAFNVVMYLFPTLIGITFFIVGLKVFNKNKKILDDNSKKLFERTNKHGVAEFDNYNDMIKMKKEAYWAQQKFFLGILIMLVGCVVAFIGLASLKDFFD